MSLDAYTEGNLLTFDLTFISWYYAIILSVAESFIFMV